MAQVVGTVEGRWLRRVVYGRPEGMTIEHCVLSAAFDREPTTCRDLCVQKHPDVELTDPAGYTFAVATDSACRNRLLHSRPIEASEYLPRLWQSGHPRLPRGVQRPRRSDAEIVAGYRAALDALARLRRRRRSRRRFAFTRARRSAEVHSADTSPAPFELQTHRNDACRRNSFAMMRRATDDGSRRYCST